MKAEVSKQSREADDRTRIMLDAIPLSCILIDRKYNLLDCNKEAEKLFGISDKQEFFDRFYESFPEYQPDGRKSKEKAVGLFKQTFDEGYTHTEWLHLIAGELVPCEVTLVRVNYEDAYAIAGYTRDLREHQALLDKINDENEKSRNMAHWYESILDTIPFLISVTDADMNWTFINKTIENLWGINRNEIKGKPCSAWCTNICNTDDCTIVRVKKGLKKTYFKHGGTSYQVDAEILTDFNDETIGFIKIVQDITRLEQMTKRHLEAEAASRAKSDFLARVSHEIRTPLNAILGITEIQLQNEELPQDAREALEKIYHSGYLLLAIINDLLDLSKIEAGKLELVAAKYDVASLINDIAQLIMAQYAGRLIDFKLEVDENIPLKLIGDEQRIKQILNNLLSNAFKYTHKGEVLLSITAQPGIDERKQAVLLVFRVSDTGQGMTQEQLAKLYTEYTRFKTEVNRATEGTGLGLNITKNLVQMMNGEIFAESVLNKGSVFTVHLPQIMAGNEVLGRKSAENLQLSRFGRASQMKKPPQFLREYMPYGKVLVVDDMETNLYVARGLMAPYGFLIDTASSGVEAVDKIQNGASYDVIFMDHFMPQMDGMETVKIIRGLGYKHPIIALTAHALVGQAEIYLENGFDGFFPKPIDLRQLNALLNRLIRDKYPPDVVEAARRQKGGHKKHFTGSSPHLSKDMRQAFIRDAEKAVEALDAIITHNCGRPDDLRTYITYVHAMKSALANVGETALSGFALRLEKAGREKNTALLSDETPEFLNALRAMIDKMAPLYDRDAGGEDQEGDEAHLGEKLAAIQAACALYDRKAAKDTLDELRLKKWPGPAREFLDTIAGHLLHSDFEEAIDAVRAYNNKKLK